jgi:hypothetical protein
LIHESEGMMHVRPWREVIPLIQLYDLLFLGKIHVYDVMTNIHIGLLRVGKVVESTTWQPPSLGWIGLNMGNTVVICGGVGGE